MSSGIYTMNSEIRSRFRKLWTRFFLWAFGVFLVYSSYGTLLSLQSSINVEEGLGTAAVACVCISGAILSILCVPVSIRRFGAKKCVWCGEIGHFIFTTINLYARWYTMLPASLLVGFGDVLLWSCMPIMNSFFAEVYAILRNDQGSDCYKSMFQSYFYAVFQMAKVAGNVISYLILHGFSKDPLQVHHNLTAVNATSSFSMLMYCGRSDCQDGNVIESMINQYVPSRVWSIRILLICLAVLCIAGIITHLIFIPENLDIFGLPKNIEFDRSGENSQMDVAGSTSVERSSQKNQSTRHVSDRDHVIGLVTERDRRPDSECSFVLSSTKATMLHILKLNQILLIPMHLYSGMSYAFVTSELTRSYTSCIFGVAWVPIHSMIFGISASLGSYSMGVIVKRFPRYYFILGAAILDALALIFCQLWSHNDVNHAFVIPIYVIFGWTQGVWIPFSQVLQVSISSGRVEIGSGINFFCYIIGIGIPFAWSTSLCVSTKIYCQIAVLVVTVLGYALLEKRMHLQPEVVTIPLDEKSSKDS